MPNSTIAGHIDNGEPLILSQEGRDICITRASVPERCKL